jgi:hypothetical protein
MDARHVEGHAKRPSDRAHAFELGPGFGPEPVIDAVRRERVAEPVPQHREHV